MSLANRLNTKNYTILTRDQIQDHVAELGTRHKYVLAELATGVGKTLAQMKFLEKTLKPHDRFLYVVPQITLIQNAKDDFIKHGYGWLIDMGDFICYASLDKYSNNVYRSVIGDEAHHLVSENRLEIFNRIECSHVLCASATISKEVWNKLLEIGNFHRFTVTLSQAIEWNILPEPIINLIEIEMDDEVRRNDFKFGKKTVKMTDRGYYDQLCKSITFWKERFESSGEKFAEINMKRVGGQRIKFMGDAKTQRAKVLIQNLGNERFVCFASSVSQAKKLGGENAVNSKKSSKDNEAIIRSFNGGEINSLFAKGMLQEGVNLVDTKYGIIIQLSNKERYLAQVLGRVLRYEGTPEVFILVLKDTVDDRFLKNSSVRINQKYFA